MKSMTLSCYLQAKTFERGSEKDERSGSLGSEVEENLPVYLIFSWCWFLTSVLALNVIEIYKLNNQTDLQHRGKIICVSSTCVVHLISRWI